MLLLCWHYISNALLLWQWYRSFNVLCMFTVRVSYSVPSRLGQRHNRKTVFLWWNDTLWNNTLCNERSLCQKLNMFLLPYQETQTLETKTQFMQWISMLKICKTKVIKLSIPESLVIIYIYIYTNISPMVIQWQV